MIRVGHAARYMGEAFAFLHPGGVVFVRSVNEDAGTACVQNPWDSHERFTVNLSELEESR